MTIVSWHFENFNLEKKSHFFILNRRTCGFQNLVGTTIQDFLIQLDMKPRMHLVEISIFSLNNVTIRPTKIMNRADKNWAHLKKIKYFKNQNFQKCAQFLLALFIILVGLTVILFSEKMLISTRCIRGFMSNWIKKNLTVSTLPTWA